MGFAYFFPVNVTDKRTRSFSCWLASRAAARLLVAQDKPESPDVRLHTCKSWLNDLRIISKLFSMSEQSVIVWDLETVPDLAAAARMLDIPGAPDGELREALGSKFPKHPLHKIVCIDASREPPYRGVAVDALGAPHLGERSKDQLKRFC
jgi:hypothetical protein